MSSLQRWILVILVTTGIFIAYLWIALSQPKITHSLLIISVLVFYCVGVAGVLLLALPMRKQRQAPIPDATLDLLLTAIDRSPFIMYIKDLQGNYLTFNRKAREIFGFKDNQPVSERDSFGALSENVGLYKHYDMLVRTNKIAYGFEDNFTLHDKQYHLYVLKTPILGEDNEVNYICGVSLDITDVIQDKLDLGNAKIMAEEAKAMQEQFMAYITHDIRTPMNGVLGLCGLMKATDLTDDQLQYTQYIEEAVGNLLVLVNDILDFSKIRAGKFELETIPFSITDTVHKSLYPLQKIANDKGISLHYSIDPDIPAFVIGDPLRLQQIIANLVGNAIKFTSNGRVEVVIGYLGTHADCVNIRFDIQDTGIGIPQDQLDTIFDVYKQNDKSTARMYGGTGLGLAIVHQLIALQNGHIDVTSEIGKGTCFSLLIPYQVNG